MFAFSRASANEPREIPSSIRAQPHIPRIFEAKLLKIYSRRFDSQWAQ